MVASFAIAATFALVACGDGDMIKVVGELKNDVDGAKESLTNKDRMEEIMNSEDVPEDSSSSKEEEKSSSSEKEDSSSSATEKSSSSSKSSSSQSEEKSSSSAAKSSSSAAKSSSSANPAPSGSCKENDPKSGFKCEWNVGAPLTPGTTLKPKDPKAPSGCSDVKWYYAPGTAAMQLKNECEEVPADGFKALGSKDYVLFAELTCDGKKHTTACDPTTGLSSKEAPVLKGECKWAKNPTTTARGGSPSGVSIEDVDKICKSATVGYRYTTDDGKKDWPSTGILSEWKGWDKKHKETYEVEAILKCAEYPTEVTSPCPLLEVSAGTDYIIECSCPGTGQCQIGAESCKVGSTKGNSVTLNKDECVEVNVVGYDNKDYLPSVVMRCETVGTQQSASATLTLGAKEYSKSGSYSLQIEIPLGTIKVGDNELGTLCLTSVSGATGVKCTGPGQ